MTLFLFISTAVASDVVMSGGMKQPFVFISIDGATRKYRDRVIPTKITKLPTLTIYVYQELTEVYPGGM